jgi:hypothetical protein
MKLRTLILTLAIAAITLTSLSGCVVVPARGYVVGPSVGMYHDHGWGYDRR